MEYIIFVLWSLIRLHSQLTTYPHTHTYQFILLLQYIIRNVFQFYLFRLFFRYRARRLI